MSLFENVVFAGGGHRCWWQAGWWDVVSACIELKPDRIAGVSAGSAMACLLYATDSKTALDYYEQTLGWDARNVYWSNALARGKRVLPHEGIYRNALATLLGGGHYERLIKTAPPIIVQFARPPRYAGVVGGVLLGLIAYNTEKYVLGSLHPKFGKRIGFVQETRTVQSCANVNELTDLIIGSSCTPPFTSIQNIDGAPSLDGGLVDNVPVSALPESQQTHLRQRQRTLVLVTRRYPKFGDIFEVDGRVYVQPSRKVAASSWDYTSPDDYRATWQQGRDDASAFLRWVEDRKKRKY